MRLEIPPSTGTADTKNAFTLLFSEGARGVHEARFPLAGSDDARAQYLQDAGKLARIVSSDPVAAVRCFHKLQRG